MARTILVLTRAQRLIVLMALDGFADEGACDTASKIRSLNSIQRQMAGNLNRAELLDAAEQLGRALALQSKDTSHD